MKPEAPPGLLKFLQEFNWVQAYPGKVATISHYILQYSFVKYSNFHGVLFLSPKCRMVTLSLPTTQHYEERESVYGAFRAEK